MLNLRISRRLVARLLIAAIAAAPPAVASAQSAADTPSRSPGDMTAAERVEMMGAANAYDRCVYDRALANIDTAEDIRRVADIALGECQSRLDDLGQTIAQWGFDALFAEGFTRNVRDRAARKLLPELAIRKSR